MADSMPRVLVCDDETFFREAIRDVLSEEQLEVVEAVDGETAIELASDPEATMRTVCSYLGKPYEEIHSVPTVGGKPVVVKTSSHETKKVFREVKPWWDGLTLREKFLVPLSRLLLRIRRIFPDRSVSAGYFAETLSA